MVSLNIRDNRGGGAILFEDRSIPANDRIVTETTPLITGVEQSYRKIRSTPFIIVHILLMILFELVVVLFPFLCYDKQVTKICDHYSPYNISLYIHAGVYIISICFDRLYHYHQDLSRRDGYLEFYHRTRNLRRIPLVTISTGNAILVATIKLLEDYQSSISPLQPWHCLAILTTIEVIIILAVLFRYLILTIRFNKQRLPPDAALDDLLSTFSTLQNSTNEIGFRDETYTENVLEKQADLIRYLRDRNDHLGRLVHRLEQQINNQRISTHVA